MTFYRNHMNKTSLNEKYHKFTHNERIKENNITYIIIIFSQVIEKTLRELDEAIASSRDKKGRYRNQNS